MNPYRFLLSLVLLFALSSLISNGSSLSAGQFMGERCLTRISQSYPELGGDLPDPWPAKSFGLSLYGSVLPGLTSILNLSADRMWRLRKWHIGFTTGITVFGPGYVSYEYPGAHLAFTAFSGMKNHHFETKLGFEVVPDRYGWEPDGLYWRVQPIPVVTIGYRYQKPGGKFFFRSALSTAGLGAGFGYTFPQHR